MIISRTSFRITLGGGGTDLKSYYSKYGGFILSTAINKYMYLILSEPFDDLIRLKYLGTEEVVKRPEELKHNVAREILKLLSIDEKLDIVSLADLPAGTGLGSSGCYTIGLLNALYEYKDKYISPTELAEVACNIEMDILKYPSGKQDPYMAALGGTTILNIGKTGSVITYSISDLDLSDLNNNMLMFYTSIQRQANEVLYDQSNRISLGDKDTIDSLHNIKDIGIKILEAIVTKNYTDVGLLFNEHWKNKKKTSIKISNSVFDDVYDYGIRNGAIGGKLSGAGSGGFFLFYVEQNHDIFIEKMECIGLKHMRYSFEKSGTRIILSE